MKNGTRPDPNMVFPVPGSDSVTYVKPTVSKLMLELRWWDLDIDEINSLIPVLSCSDLEKVRDILKRKLGKNA